MSDAVTAEIKDGSLVIEFRDHGVTIGPPFDFDVIKAACSCLHDTLAGVSECQLVMAAVAASADTHPKGQDPAEGLGS